jgi:hypothetical protein
MSSIEKWPCNPGRHVLFACLAGVLACSAAGCFDGGGGATLSAADQAKARETTKKKFDNFGDTQGRGPRR